MKRTLQFQRSSHGPETPIRIIQNPTPHRRIRISTCRIIPSLISCLMPMLFLSCNENPRIPAEGIPRIHRYEKALMDLDTAHIRSGLEEAFPEFRLYLQGADLHDTINLLRIKYFIQDPIVKNAYAKIESTYGDLKALELEIGRLFFRIRELFPQFRTPEIYTYISYYDFTNRILYMDSILSIAIDLYLDDNEKEMNQLGIPRYLSRRLNSRFLLPDIAKVVGSSFLSAKERNTLLDQMVSDGKTLYFMKEVLPKADPEELLGYTRDEILWSRSHEKEVWQYMIRQNLLFETDPLKFRHFVNEGPFNPLLPGAPSRLSQYMGLQIVERFMDKTGNDWKALQETDSRNILRISGYKP